MKRLFQKKGASTDPIKVLGIDGAGVAMTFAIAIILTRLLGSETFGDYAYAFTLVEILSLIALFGNDKLMVREVSKARADGDLGRIKALEQWSSKWIVLISMILVLLAGSLSLSGLPPFNDPSVQTSFQTAIISIPFFAFIARNKAILQGEQRVLSGQLMEKWGRPGILLLLVLLLIFYPSLAESAIYPVLLHVAATVLAACIGWILLKRAEPNTTPSFLSEHQKRTLLKAGASLVLLKAFMLINSRLDLLILGSFNDMESVGIFRIVIQLGGLIGMLLLAVNTVIAPRIAEHSNNKNIQDLQRVLTRTVRGVFLAGLPVSIVLMVFGSFIMGLFGPDFPKGAHALAYYSGAQLFSLFMGSVGQILIMTDHEKDALIAMIGGTVIHASFSFFLIPLYGLTGAGVASAIGVVSLNLLLFERVHRKLGLNPTVIASTPK